MQIARILLTLFGLVLAAASGPSMAPEAEATQANPLRCELCKQIIKKHYYKIPGLSEFYCETCHQAAPKCLFCGRPMSGVEAPEKVCVRCRAKAVTSPEEARQLYHQVRDWLEGDLNLAWSWTISLRLTSDLPEAVGIEGKSGFRELGAFLREGESGTVVLLEGLPRDLLIETLAHELAHAWQAENCPPKSTLLWKEGFAQWVAAKALDGFNCEEALAILEHRQDLYGKGYRMIRELESKHGREGVFCAVREGR